MSLENAPDDVKLGCRFDCAAGGKSDPCQYRANARAGYCKACYEKKLTREDEAEK